MKTTMLLVEQQQRIVSLLATVKQSVTSRVTRTPEVIDAIIAQLAMEEAAFEDRRVAGALDEDRHRAAHLRARLALFRIATTPPESAAFARSVDELSDVFRERPQEIVDALERELDETTDRRLATELARLVAAFRAPSSSDYLVAYAVARCERAIERVA